MTLLDLIIVTVAFLLVWLATLPLIPVLTIALGVIVLVRVARGERIP
jgi:hypothetical protein